MTKQHFEAIAKIIKARLDATNDKDVQKELLYLTSDLSDYLVTTNPLFNHNKFQVACGFTKSQLEKML